MMKSKTSKKTFRNLPPKSIEVKPPSNSSQKTMSSTVTSKKEITLTFLKELLHNIIASRENTSFKEFTDSGGTDLSYQNLFLITAHEEMEGESKKSVFSSLKSSRVSMSSERTMDKLMSPSEEYRIATPKKSSSSVIGEKQDTEPAKSLETLEGTKDEEITWTKYMRIVFTTGNYYEGEMEECLMHGKGIYVWNDGTIYEGEFKNGYPSGKGRIILPELSIYNGEFCNGYFHGYGILNISETPMIYKGEWKSGKKHGKGWICYGPDNWYDGDWVDDMRHGYGYRNYAKKLKYKGQWSYNNKNGTGSMLWHNNDYYHGEWQWNQQHGYGEYTWNLSYNPSFTFLINNWYKGAWMNGKRTGLGLMHFGAESGSKLAGKWLNDLKDGPGILSCGNGEVIASDPLFENDKPVHKSSLYKLPKNQESTAKPLMFSKLEAQNLFRTVVNLVNTKQPLYEYTEDILAEIRVYTTNILEYFVKTIEFSNSEQSLWNPLKIATHVVTESVNLKFYIAEILSCYEARLLPNAKSHQKPRQNLLYATDYLSQKLYEVQEKPPSVNEFYQKLFEREERLIRNFITINLPKLREIYNYYAKLATPETAAKPVLVRLFLWQLMRDIQLYYTISLVEADLYFASNPSSCTESDYNPFEEIYFWQFLQYLVGCSWLFHRKADHSIDVSSSGFVTRIFRRFLEKEVYPNFGKSDGTALREHINLLPIKAVYQLYCALGEPHSLRTFLNHTCTKNRRDPPCYFGRYLDSGDINITSGYNAVSIANKVSYIPTKTIHIPEDQSEIDIFRNTLFTFRHLGRYKIVKCITNIYPNVRTSQHLIDVNYKVNFLEFYEILLLCSAEKIQDLKKMEEQKKVDPKKSSAGNDNVSISRSLKKDTSKKKKTKSFGM